MQVSVEKTSESSRKMTVSISEEVIQEKMESRFKSLKNKAKMSGFRPGKVPLHVVKKMYAEQVRSEVLGDLLNTSYSEALEEQQLNPVGQPHVHPADAETGFEYTAEFDVLPEISLENISSLQIQRPLATIEQTDLDAMVLKLREQQATWHTVERSAQDKDRVTIHFSAVYDGENFTDGKVEDFQLIIGSKKMVPDFDDQLIGLDLGASKKFEATYPKNYQNEKLAGNTAEFEIELIKVEESHPAEFNEEFIKGFEIEDGSKDTFYAQLKESIEKDLALALKNQLKNWVVDSLIENIPLTLPKALVDQEVQRTIQSYQARAKEQNIEFENLKLPSKIFEKQAQQRLAIGLIFSEIITINHLVLDDTKVRSMMEDMVRHYEDPKTMMDQLYANEQQLNQVKQLVIEEQAVDWVVSQAQMNDKLMSLDQALQPQQVSTVNTDN